MLPDIVIDTNVLCHADNPVEPRCAASRSLMSRLLDVPTQLCVDRGFALDRARNRSHICAEYLDMVVPGSVPYAVLTHLFASGRVREVDRRPDHATAKKVMRMVAKARDRIFVGVAHNSSAKTLVSHDFQDFAAQKRHDIRKDIGVSIIEAHESAPLLA